ncbi:Num1p [Nakaseomyces bracarensis]|uniref:Num1p n=1 Tax=Nakaseomyces bracarensis TaxID=273131 RepID=UPI0038727065
MSENLDEELKQTAQDVTALTSSEADLPMFAGSHSYGSMVRSNNSKDINFTMDLSENLLMECRRLQAANDKFKKRLEELTEKHDVLIDSEGRLRDSKESLQQEVEELKQLNWDLEANLDNCNKSLKLLRNDRDALAEQAGSLGKELEKLKTEFEVMKLENKRLQDQLGSQQTQTEEERNDLQQRLHNLNDENDELVSKNKSVNEKLNNLQVNLLRFLKDKKYVDENKSDVEDDIFDHISDSNSDISLEEVEELARKHDMKLIPQDQEIHPKLTTDEMIDHIDKEGYKTIKLEEWRSIQDELKAPPVDKIKDSLMDNNKDQQIKIMKWLAEQNNRVVITEEKYNDMNNKLSNPNKDLVSQNAEKIGYVISEKSEYEELKEKATTPSVDLIKIFARNNNMVAIPSERFEELESTFKHPDLEFLREKANEQNQVLIPIKELTEMKETIENPDMQFIKAAATKNNEKLITIAEYEEMMRQLENPNLEFVVAKAELMNQKVIPLDVYEDLENTSKHPTMEFLNQKAFENGQKIIQASEYEDLLRSVEQPTLEYISERAEDYDQKLISSDEFEELKLLSQDPPIDFLSARAASKGYEMLKTKQYDDLLRKTSEPTSRELEAIAAGIGYVAIPDSEYVLLKEVYDKPSLAFIKEKSENEGHVVIEKTEYDDLRQKAFDKDSAIENITNFGFKAVPLSEYNDLINAQLKTAPMEEVRKRLELEGYVMLESDSYKKLSVPVYEKGTLQDTMTLCEKYSLRAIPIEEFEHLERNAQSAIFSIDELINRVKSHGFMVHSSEEYNELQRQLLEPDLTYLIEKAQKYNNILVDKDEFARNEELVKNTPVEFVREKAAHYGYLLIETKRWEDMNAELENPSLDMLKDRAEKIDCIIMTAEEKNKLDEQMAKPPLEYLKEKARRQRKELVDLVEYRELVRKTTNPTGDEIKQYANTLQSVVLLNDEYNELQKKIDYPSLEYLVSSLENFNYVAVSSDQYEHEIERYNNPSNEYLSEKLSDKGMIMVNNNEYQNLVVAVENPELAYLEEKATNFRKILVDKEEFQYKLDTFENPSIEFLQSKASLKNHQLINTDELNDIKSKLRNPTIEYLNEKAQMLDKVLVDRSAYQTQVRQLEAPSIEFLRKNARRESMVLLPRNEAETMQTMLSKPDLDHVRENAKELGYELVEFDKYKELTKNTENPTFEFLQARTESMNYVIIRKDKWEATRERLDNPSLDILRKQSNDMGATLFTADELNEHDNNIRSKAASLMSPSSKVRASKQYFEQLVKEEKQQPGKIIGHARALGFVTLPTDEYEKLLKNQKDENMKKNELYLNARQMNLAIIDKNSYAKLVQQRATQSKLSFEELQTFADQLEMDLVKKEDSQQATETTGNRLVFTEEKKEKEVINGESPFLSSQKDSLSLEDLSKMANELGYFLLPNKYKGKIKNIPDLTSDTTISSIEEEDTIGNNIKEAALDHKLDISDIKSMLTDTEYDVFNKNEIEELSKKSNRKPTVNEIKSLAQMSGLTLLSKTEEKKLRAGTLLTDNELKEEASKRSLIILSLSSYKALAAKKYQPQVKTTTKLTRLEIVKKAPSFGLAAIDEREYRNLQSHANKTNVTALDEATIKKMAKEKNLVVLSKEKLLIMEKESKPKTKSELVRILHARYNLVAITKVEYNKLKTQSSRAASTPSTTRPNSPETITTSSASENDSEITMMKDKLEQNGYLIIRNTAFITTPYAKTPTSKKVVVIPRMYYMTLLARTNPKPLKRTPVTQKKANQLDPSLVSELQEQHIRSRTAPSSPTSEIPPPVINMAFEPLPKDSEINTPRKYTPSQTPTHSVNQTPTRPGFLTPTHSTLNVPKSTPMKPPMNRSSSVDTIGTINTVASFNEQVMIPALTQTVIGEYLYKYYPKLGHIGGEGRHRRYFWIHPYSMTLYWSETNPVMENASHSKTKGVSILSVSVIPDTNSHPSGLYHKSIIVTTDERSVVFTCPTRERHNVWYNSLRYLIKRSVDGISYDEIVEDVDDSMYAGKVFPLGPEGQHVQRRMGSSFKSSMRKPSVASFRDRVDS